jgi:nitroimidazol reductase NimA-like FMN-containing flavoprotein (pyridoxamine 5'-phosphate oxidase superfamily)
MDQLIEKTKNEINNQLYLTLATTDEFQQPWAAPVYFAYDEQYNCYWVSEAISQHSLNIKLNNKVMATIFNSMVPHGQGFGIYLQGSAIELNQSDEITHAIELLSGRIQSSNKPPVDKFLTPFPRRIYKLSPLKFWINTIIEEQGIKMDRRIDVTNYFLSK